jgi:hypothetical protein
MVSLLLMSVIISSAGANRHFFCSSVMPCFSADVVRKDLTRSWRATPGRFDETAARRGMEWMREHYRRKGETSRSEMKPAAMHTIVKAAFKMGHFIR